MLAEALVSCAGFGRTKGTNIAREDHQQLKEGLVVARLGIGNSSLRPLSGAAPATQGHRTPNSPVTVSFRLVASDLEDEGSNCRPSGFRAPPSDSAQAAA